MAVTGRKAQTTYSLRERAAVGAVHRLYATTMALPPRRQDYPQWPATVERVVDLTPAWRRVVLGAPEFADYRPLGPDEYVGLYLPPPGQPLTLPPRPSLNPQSALRRLPADRRPDLRWYTVRRHDPAAALIEIDVVAIGHDGPGARWISRVAAGDVVGVRVGSAPYASAPPRGRHLLLADETALPGLLAILDHHDAHPDPGRELLAYLEVPDSRYLPADARGRGVRTLYRGGQEPGSALLAELRATGLPSLDYAWCCAEGGTVAAAKRQLTIVAGLPRRQIMGTGLWTVGRARR